MGFVDDESDSDVEVLNTADLEPDIEEAGANGNQSLIFSSAHRRKRSYTTDPRTPTTRNNDLLAVTRSSRKGITESEEIREELEDDTYSDFSPFHNRRHSTMSTPAKNTYHARIDDALSEGSPLLGRSSTGRSYRDKRRRRSAPAGEGRSRSKGSQSAVGGWWKLEWWKGRKN